MLKSRASCPSLTRESTFKTPVAVTPGIREYRKGSKGMEPCRWEVKSLKPRQIVPRSGAVQRFPDLRGAIPWLVPPLDFQLARVAAAMRAPSAAQMKSA